MSENKNINYTNNDGAKFRYSASRDPKNVKTPKPERIKEALTRRAVILKTNKILAVFVLVTVVLLSTFLSVHRAVARRANLVEEYYKEIELYVFNMESGAVSLASLGEAVAYDSADVTELKALTYRLGSVIDGPFWADADLARTIHGKAETVFNRIYYGNSTEAAKASAKEYFDAVDKNYRLLGSSESYNEAAKEYNRVLDRFPTSVSKRDKAPVFERFNDVIESTVTENGDESSGASIVSIASSAVKTISSKLHSLSLFQIAGIVIAILAVTGYFSGRGRARRR